MMSESGGTDVESVCEVSGGSGWAVSGAEGDSGSGFVYDSTYCSGSGCNAGDDGS